MLLVFVFGWAGRESVAVARRQGQQDVRVTPGALDDVDGPAQAGRRRLVVGPDRAEQAAIHFDVSLRMKIRAHDGRAPRPWRDGDAPAGPAGRPAPGGRGVG